MHASDGEKKYNGQILLKLFVGTKRLKMGLVKGIVAVGSNGISFAIRFVVAFYICIAA